MNIEFFKNRSRMLAAGLCGAAVLTFAALESPAQAQEDPNGAKSEQTEESLQKSEKEESRKATSSLDLSEVKFEGEIIRKLGESAVIVKSDEQDLLLPLSVVSSLENSQTADDTLADASQDKTEQADQDNEKPETVAEVETETTVEPSQAELQVGDKVQVQLASTDAELVALENNVLTARDGEMLMQLPANEISEEASSRIKFNAKTNGETSIMTLQEAIDDRRELTVSQGWSTEMPKETTTGVIVANKPGYLMLAAVSDNAVKLIQVPQTLQAGEAVSLSENSSGDIMVEPIDNTVAYEELKIKGKLVSQNDDFVVLETGGEHYLLPGSLELKAVDSDEKAIPGNMVSVTLPAGDGDEEVGVDENVDTIEAIAPDAASDTIE